MTNPLPYGALVRYVNAAPARRGSRAAHLRTQAESTYDPRTDYWLPMRNAITADRKTTRDGSAPRAVARTASARRKTSYHRAADQWAELATRWTSSTAANVSPALITVGGLELTVRPMFAEARPDGTTEVVMVWFAAEELTSSAVSAAQCALARAYPDRVAVVVDLPRADVHRAAAGGLAALQPWLDAEAAGLAHLLDQAA